MCRRIDGLTGSRLEGELTCPLGLGNWGYMSHQSRPRAAFGCHSGVGSLFLSKAFTCRNSTSQQAAKRTPCGQPTYQRCWQHGPHSCKATGTISNHRRNVPVTHHEQGAWDVPAIWGAGVTQHFLLKHPQRVPVKALPPGRLMSTVPGIGFRDRVFTVHSRTCSLSLSLSHALSRSLRLSYLVVCLLRP